MQNELHSGIRFSIRHLLALILFAATAATATKCFLAAAERNRRQRAESQNLHELSQLDMAIESYQHRYGEVPPASEQIALVKHLRHLYPHKSDHEKLLTRTTANVAQLDVTEILVLFLSGEANKRLAGNDWPSFEFDPGRLSDSDSDGWLEYRARDGETYRYADGNATIYCRETERMVTLGNPSSQRLGRTTWFSF